MDIFIEVTPHTWAKRIGNHWSKFLIGKIILHFSLCLKTRIKANTKR
jgi:hypothetical protein